MSIPVKNLLSCFGGALCCLFFVRIDCAQAGIMLDGVNESQYVNYANQSQFAPIGRFATGNGSGTLIAPNWVLTAGHLGNVDAFQIRGTGTSYSVAERIFHPTFLVNGSNLALGFDLQLIRLTTNVQGVTPASIYRGTSEVGSTASITGFGFGGVGSVGMDTTNFPQAQRAGTNVIDSITTLGNAQNTILLTDFDSGTALHNTLAGAGSSPTTTSLEYHLATWDSGGGVFIFENGQWSLAGVNSAVTSQRAFLDPNNTSNPPLTDNVFGYGAVSIITRVSSFTGFIDNTVAVPEPTSLSLIGAALAIGVLGRRRMRNAAARKTV